MLFQWSWARLWWNWQTRYFEVVVGQPVQVQVLLSAPCFTGFFGAAQGDNLTERGLTKQLKCCITCMLNMKTANVRQLRHAFGEVMEWITEGQQVEIVKKGKIIALLSPPPRPKPPAKVKLPDFEARQKRIFGDRVLPGNIVAEERESYE